MDNEKDKVAEFGRLIHISDGLPRYLAAFSGGTCRALALLVLLTAGCGGNGTPAAEQLTSNLQVLPNVALKPDLRVTFAPAAGVADAERVQDQLATRPLAITSVMRSPFRSLDVKLPGSAAVAARASILRSLRADPSVVAVDECPCPEANGSEHRTQIGEFLYKLARSCASSRGPLPVSGCLSELAEVPPGPFFFDQARTREGVIRLLLFDAVTVGAQDVDVETLRGTLTSGGASFIAEAAPPEGWRVTASKSRIPLIIDGQVYRLSPPKHLYEDEASFPPGEVRTQVLEDSFTVQALPRRGLGPPIRIKGAALVYAPADEGFDRQLSVMARAVRPG